MAIIWLIGKTNNVDIIWSAYENEVTTSPDIIRNTNLFEEKKYKHIYNKKYAKFFELKPTFHNELIIKGLQKFDDTIMNEKQDKIIYIDTLNKKELFNLYCEVLNIKFIKNEFEIIKNLTSLEDLSTAITLKKLNLEIEHWNLFFTKEKINWYQQQKENKLIFYGIFNPNQIISVMTYLINSNAKQKEILLFLQAKIKQGHQIWRFNKFWESCAKCL